LYYEGVNTMTSITTNNIINTDLKANERPYASYSSPTDDISPWHLADIIFVSLMENGFDEVSKSNRYIIQIIKKFKYFRTKADKTFFEISFKDLNSDALDRINGYTEDCKSVGEKYAKLDGVFAEVIAHIAQEAEPMIVSSTANESRLWNQTALYEIRDTVSYRWKLVRGDIN